MYCFHHTVTPQHCRHRWACYPPGQAMDACGRAAALKTVCSACAPSACKVPPQDSNRFPQQTALGDEATDPSGKLRALRVLSHDILARPFCQRPCAYWNARLSPARTLFVQTLNRTPRCASTLLRPGSLRCGARTCSTAPVQRQQGGTKPRPR